MKQTRGNALVAVLVLIAVAALGGAGYFFRQNQILKSELKTSSPNPSSSSNNSSPFKPSSNTSTQPPTPADETANWKTYTDTEQGWQFKYPDKWFLKKLSNTSGSVLVSPKPIPQIFEIPNGSISIGLNECTNTTTGQRPPCEKTVSERVEMIQRDILSYTLKKDLITVSGRNATQISGVYGPSPMENMYGKDTIIPWKNSYLLMINLIDKDKILEQTYDQILSTFRFE